MAATSANLGEGATGWAGLVQAIISPAFYRSVALYSAGMAETSADLFEDTCRRGCLPYIIPAPTRQCADAHQTTSIFPTSTNLGESSAWWCRFAIKIGTPAHKRTIAFNCTGVGISCTDGLSELWGGKRNLFRFRYGSRLLIGGEIQNCSQQTTYAAAFKHFSNFPGDLFFHFLTLYLSPF
jgi:hypothetical protein